MCLPPVAAGDATGGKHMLVGNFSTADDGDAKQFLFGLQKLN
jgi:hypothetical protein